jgi:branched-chain amino acid transport system ATP-binding protein
MADAGEALLRLDGVYTDIGRYQILYGVDLTVRRGGVTMLLGRNGAGKTTTLRLGIAYVPENMGIFGKLTVRENMLLATGAQGFAKDHLDRVLAFFPALKLKWEAAAGSLSGGQKQMLAIGRAIVEPRRLLLVDEPTKGLSPAMVDQLVEALLRMKKEQTTILLVEQNFRVALAMGDNVAVMDQGASSTAAPRRRSATTRSCSNGCSA